MDELIAFVRARLDEDEAAAKAAFRSILVAEGFHVFAPAHPGVPQLPVADAIDAETAAHIARHDPARVLREVAAKRRVLAAYADCVDASEVFREKLGTGTHMAAAAESYANVIRWDATVWSGHADYRPGWAP